MIIIPLGIALGVCLAVVVVVSSAGTRGAFSRKDRSARSVEPLALGCTLLLVIAFVVLIYFAREHK